MEPYRNALGSTEEGTNATLMLNLLMGCGETLTHLQAERQGLSVGTWDLGLGSQLGLSHSIGVRTPNHREMIIIWGLESRLFLDNSLALLCDGSFQQRRLTLPYLYLLYQAAALRLLPCPSDSRAGNEHRRYLLKRSISRIRPLSTDRDWHTWFRFST